MRAWAPAKLAETARICTEVYGIRPLTVAVAERFGIADNTARNMIVGARKAGYPIPSDSTKWRRNSHTRLRCSCGWSCELDQGIPGLQRHTLSVHGRNPSPVERVPSSQATT